MAFSATIRNVQYLGPCRTSMVGDWSGSAGDTAGSMAIAGVVIKADFMKFDSDNTWQGLARVSTSVSNGISTITVNNQDSVTTGYFVIEKLG